MNSELQTGTDFPRHKVKVSPCFKKANPYRNRQDGHTKKLCPRPALTVSGEQRWTRSENQAWRAWIKRCFPESPPSQPGCSPEGSLRLPKERHAPAQRRGTGTDTKLKRRGRRQEGHRGDRTVSQSLSFHYTGTQERILNTRENFKQTHCHENQYIKIQTA